MNRGLIDDILAGIKKAAGVEGPHVNRTSHKHDQYIEYDILTKTLRDLVKSFKPRFMALTLDDRLQLAEDLCAMHLGELGHTANFILAYSVKELGPQHFSKLDKITAHYRSWSQVDGFCVEVLQPLLLAYPAETLKQLELWNRSENRWQRRSSVVVFVRKVGKSGQFTDQGLRLCENLIHDPEDIVQKGVGWALKDMMRGDRERILEYVINLRKRGISAVITLYAIKDLKGEERSRVLAVTPDSKQQK